MKDLNAKNESRKRFIIIIVITSLIFLIILFTAKARFAKNNLSMSASGISADYALDTNTYNSSTSDKSKNIVPSTERETLPTPKQLKEIPSSNNQIQGIQDIKISKSKRYVIKNANLYIKVFSLDESIDSISQIAKLNGGDIISTNINPQAKSGYVELQVDVNKFQEAINKIKDTASVVESESIFTSDANTEVIDLEAALVNKRAQETRLREFFEKAKDVKDLLAIEKNITVVRGEIGRLEARQKSLKNQTSYSKISVTLREDAEILPSKNNWRPLQVAKNSFNTLIKKIQNIINYTISVSIASLPIFILSIFGLWIAYSIIKKIFKKITKNRKNREENITDIE